MTISTIHTTLRGYATRQIDAGRTSIKLIAAKTNLSQPTVSNYVRGRRGLSVDALSRIAAALGLEAELLPKKQPHN